MNIIARGIVKMRMLNRISELSALDCDFSPYIISLVCLSETILELEFIRILKITVNDVGIDRRSISQKWIFFDVLCLNLLSDILFLAICIHRDSLLRNYRNIVVGHSKKRTYRKKKFLEFYTLKNIQKNVSNIFSNQKRFFENLTVY